MSKTGEKELVEFAKRELVSARSKVAALELLLEEYGTPTDVASMCVPTPQMRAPIPVQTCSPLPVQLFSQSPLRHAPVPPPPSSLTPSVAPTSCMDEYNGPPSEAKRDRVYKHKRRRHSNVVRPGNKDKFLQLLTSLCQKPIEKCRLLKTLKNADEEFRHLTAPALSRWIAIYLEKGELVRTDRAKYVVNRELNTAVAPQKAEDKNGSYDGFIPINLLGVQAQG